MVKVDEGRQKLGEEQPDLQQKASDHGGLGQAAVPLPFLHDMHAGQATGQRGREHGVGSQGCCRASAHTHHPQGMSMPRAAHTCGCRVTPQTS